jgi:DNA-directed RNA polymerase subunit N (RpoN/RPB10)
VTPNDILKGNKCFKCKKHLGITHEDYINILKEKCPNIKVLDIYKGNLSKILHECSCGNKWLVSPDNVLRGGKCAICNNDKRTIKSYVNKSKKQRYIPKIQKYEYNKKILKQLRVANNFTCKDIADKCSINLVTYYGYENNAKTIDINILHKLANLYNVDIEILLKRKEDID